MRLAHKLSLAQMVLISALLFALAAVQVRREIHLFQNDMRRDQRLTGQALGAAVADVWTRIGRDRALRLLQDANAAESSVHIGWIWLEGQDAPPQLRSGQEWAAPLHAGQEVVHIEKGRHGPGSLQTYVPVRIAGVPPGAVEISESLLEQRRFMQATLLHMLATTTLIGLGAALISIVLGSSFIVQPMSLLVTQARHVGSGDLTQRVEVRYHDEIGELAAEMNLMCDRLEESTARLLSETNARISALEQLRHADRLATVGTLSSGIAHELGTPLNVVTGRAKMIETGVAAGAAAIDCARIVREQAERMTRIIRQLLDFSRRGRPEQKEMDPRPIVGQSLALMESFARKYSVALEFRDETDLPPRVLMDPNQIQQVLTNLILNGIQAMQESGTLTVRVKSATVTPPGGYGRDEGQFVLIQVEDEGCGIPADCLHQIFDPFFTTKEVGEGTGLGLSVSYGIVREHGGWIEVDSEARRGSCFRVYLPDVGEECADAS